MSNVYNAACPTGSQSTRKERGQMQRGETINGKGKFVGKAKRSSVWAWYPGSDASFEEMCRLFDKLYGTN